MSTQPGRAAAIVLMSGPTAAAREAQGLALGASAVGATQGLEMWPGQGLVLAGGGVAARAKQVQVVMGAMAARTHRWAS